MVTMHMFLDVFLSQKSRWESAFFIDFALRIFGIILLFILLLRYLILSAIRHTHVLYSTHSSVCAQHKTLDKTLIPTLKGEVQ